jgi:hypothetical protein
MGAMRRTKRSKLPKAKRKPRVRRKVDRNGYSQGWEGDWEQVSDVDYVQCCDCALVHVVKHRVNGGLLEWQWNLSDSETKKARRLLVTR